MHALHRFITPDTLPHAIVLAAVVLGFAAILYAFVKKAPFYALIVIVVTLFVLFMAGCESAPEWRVPW